MEPEVVNKNKNCVFNDQYVGRDLYITMYQDNEREFVVTHNANIKPVAYFTGRETELQELRQRVEAGRKSVIVSGMGGIGKTHICRKLFEEYINKHAEEENGLFRHIGYIEYNGDMGSSLQNCLKFKKQDNLEQNREAAWKELEYLASDGKLLLFIDNVDKPIGEDSGLQRLKGIPGAVVLTSRQASFSDEFESYQIGFLDMEQCKEIYDKIRYRGSGRKVDLEEVEDLEYIIENLAGRHTITVELIAHLARTKTWSVRKLRERLENNGFRLTFHKDGELVNIQESYEVLYDLSKLTGAEKNILEAFSVFPYIPLAAEMCNEWLLADAGVSEDDDILMELYQKGWLQFDADQESYAMHPVFAQFIYEKCKPNMEKHDGWIKACYESLQLIEGGSLLKCRQYIPFAENIVEKFEMGGVLQYWFIGGIASLLCDTAEYKKAELLYEKSLQISKKVMGEEHLCTAASYNSLAMVYERQGKYKKAEELYEKGLQISEKVLGEEYSCTAVSYIGLALVCEAQGEYEKAELLHKKGLQINEKVLGEEHLSTAISYNNLADVYMAQEEYEKAEALYEKSLRIKEKVLGEEHPSTARGYNNLAGAYKAQGEYEKAEKLYKKSLRIREKVLGEEHPSIAIGYNNLAGVYFAQGEYEKAEALYEKSLRIKEKVLGEEHPSIAISHNNIAVMYVVQRKYQKAMFHYLKAYSICLAKLRIGHPRTQSLYDNIKIAFYKWNPKGNFEQWLREQTREIRENRFHVIWNETEI